ncbi:bifunctional pinoresinol-lariciresinol reductase 2 [Rhypophila sp. PSN 637]
MAIIAVAGGHGNVAPHVIDALASRGRHRIIVLSRRPRPETLDPGVDQHKQVDYHNVDTLAAALEGVNVVLSFILPYADKGNLAQKNLIDACIKAGVRRFAPSEWALGSNTANPFYSMRAQVRSYLEAVNKPTLKLEYTCFQPGLFLDYFTYPMQSAKHLKITQHYIDFESRQAILVGDGSQPVTFTLIDDLAMVVALAVEYEDGPWPANGGVAGWTTTSAELVRIGERIRGGQMFRIHRVDEEDLVTGDKLNTEWCPVMAHPSIPPDQLDSMTRAINFQAMKGIVAGEWVVDGYWNRLLEPRGFRFQDPVEFLERWWAGRE